MIYINFQDAIIKARNIEDNGNQIQKRAKSIVGLEGYIGSAWKGDSASLFIKKLDKHARNLMKHGEELSKHADSLRVSAERLKAAEDFGKQLFGR